MVIKADRFLSEWGSVAEVAGNSSKPRIAVLVILRAEHSTQGNQTSSVWGEILITMPTASAFDPALIGIENLPNLQMLGVNESDIVTRKDMFYSAYVIPFKGVLALDDTMLGVDFLKGQLSYGDIHTEVQLRPNHFPEWGLSGGRTQFGCVLIKDKTIPDCATIENMHNLTFTIKHATLRDVPFMSTSIDEHNVKFSLNEGVSSQAQNVESMLLVDVEVDGKTEINKLEIPFKILCPEVANANLK